MAGGPMHHIFTRDGREVASAGPYDSWYLGGSLWDWDLYGQFYYGGHENTIQLPPAVTASILAILVALHSGIQPEYRPRLCPLWQRDLYLGTVTVLAVNLDRLLPTLQLVFSSAFGQTAAVVLLSDHPDGHSKWGRAWSFLRISGLGSAPIAAAAADREPVEQGLISMTGTSSTP